MLSLSCHRPPSEILSYDNENKRALKARIRRSEKGRGAGANEREQCDDEKEELIRDSSAREQERAPTKTPRSVLNANPFAALDSDDPENEEEKGDATSQEGTFDMNLTAKDVLQKWGPREINDLQAEKRDSLDPIEKVGKQPKSKKKQQAGSDQGIQTEGNGEEDTIFITTQSEGTPLRRRLWSDGKEAVGTPTGAGSSSQDQRSTWSSGSAKALARLKAKEAVRLAKEHEKQAKQQ
ncbi:hypothetical protein R1sor_018102 [Riccia sorocarpa]|uniref:Uncharacterized protein n=1 Tax=Riccia sorocarpa TaxID=122646 RepID=A0ABD3I8Q5_9MARC